MSGPRIEISLSDYSRQVKNENALRIRPSLRNDRVLLTIAGKTVEVISRDLITAVEAIKRTRRI